MDHTKLHKPFKHFTKHISYTERMLDAIEKRKRASPLKLFRKKAIDHQHKMNYQK